MNETDIHALIENRVEENLSLAYRGKDALSDDENAKEAISREASSFANSEGGTIIYGVVSRSLIPERIDGIDPNRFSRLRLEGVLKSRIQKPVSGVKVYEIALSPVQRGRAVYVVEIPRSNDAPHQASDKRYYKRANNAAVAMEDYEVRDVINRRKTPEVRATIAAKVDAPFGEAAPFRKVIARIEVRLKNLGPVPARDVHAEIRIPAPILSPLTRFPRQWTQTCEGQELKIFPCRLNTDSGPMTLFPDAEADLLDERTSFIALEATPQDLNREPPYRISCVVYADQAAPTFDSVGLRDVVKGS